MRTSAPRLLPLFRSEWQARLTALVLLQPDRAWTSDELRRALEVPASSLHRELQRLEDAGLVHVSRGARPFTFTAATDAPAYRSLAELLALTVGVEADLRRALLAVPGVEAAAIHGSWAAGRVGPRSDVDVIVVGEVDRRELRRTLRAVGTRAGRSIDLTTFTSDDWHARLAADNGFVRKALGGSLIPLVGELATVPARG